MISNFHDEATCVKLHSSSHKATLFRKSFSRIKRLFQTLTLKRKLVQGNYYRRTHLVTCNTCKTRLVTHSTLLTTRSTRSTHFSTRSTRLSTRSTRFSTCSTRLSTRSTRFSTRSTRLSTRSICMSSRSTRSITCRSFYN